MDGFQIQPMSEAAGLGDIFSTVTGDTHVICTEPFAIMKDGAMICNSGHFDVGLALDDLAKLVVTINKNIYELVDQYILKNGHRLYVPGEGRLINLAADHGHPARVMDTSFAAQALATEWAIKNTDKLEHIESDHPQCQMSVLFALSVMTLHALARCPMSSPRLTMWSTPPCRTSFTPPAHTM